MSVTASSAYYDFQSLSALKAEAAQAPNQAIKEVASQFESLFMQMMVKSMREATMKGGLFESNQMDLYQSMLDQQVSMQLSAQGGLGLADILVQQLDSPASAVAEEGADSVETPAQGSVTSMASFISGMRAGSATASSPADAAAVVTNRGGENRAGENAAVGSTDAAAPEAVTQALGASTERKWEPESIEEFVEGVWDHAVGAAKELGLDPLVLVAQSALETGWGKRMIKAFDGSNSFNLFGIKAGGSWEGSKATVDTLEFRDGIAAKEQANFRVYDSLASSFSDYVSFLKSNPRYQQALEKVGDAQAFLHGLQDAGYATDPNYAQKIMNIIHAPSLGSAVAQVKKL